MIIFEKTKNSQQMEKYKYINIQMESKWKSNHKYSNAHTHTHITAISFPFISHRRQICLQRTSFTRTIPKVPYQVNQAILDTLILTKFMNRM